MSVQLASPTDPDTVSDENPGIDSEVHDASVSRSMFGGWLLIPLVLVLLMFVIFRQIDLESPPPVQDSPAIGKPAPQIDLVQLSDDPSLQPIREIGPGKVTLLHFWGTWCGPCRMEYPELSATMNELETDGRFVFLPVSCEMRPSETFEGLWSKTRDYFESEGINSKAFADALGVTRRSLVERLERNSLFYPTSVLIDGQGKIAGVWEGYAPEGVSQIKSRASELISSQ